MSAARASLVILLLAIAGGLWAWLAFPGDAAPQTLGGPVAIRADAAPQRPPETAGRSGSAPAPRAGDTPGGPAPPKAGDVLKKMLSDAREEHAKVNSGYGNSVTTAAPDDEGERGGKVSAHQGAPVGELTWDEDVESEGRCTLTVRVVDQRQQPVADVAVSLRREEKWETQLHLVARTDAQGRLVARALPVSYYRASIEEDDALPFTRSWRCDGDQQEEIVLTKRDGDTRIFGDVLEAGTDAPLADTSLTVQEITSNNDDKDFRTYTFVTVNDDGGFDFVVKGGKGWQYRLYAQAPGYEFTNADVYVTRGEHRRVTFHLEPFGRVEGQVLTSDGRPAAGAKVHQGGSAALVGLDADQEGRFSMSARDGKPLEVVAHLGGEVGRQAIRPVLAKGETRAGVIVQLAPGRRLVGVVTREGEPMPLAEIIASERSPMGWLSTTQADAEGRFTIPGAPARRLQVSATGSAERVIINPCTADDSGCRTADVEVEVPFVPKG